MILISILATNNGMSTFKQIIQNILTEAIDAPPAIHFQIPSQVDPSFVNYIKNAENGIRKGFDKKRGRWFPHKSVEGGSDTIAYGHKLQQGENYSKGITEDEAIKLLNRDIQIARDKARKEVDKNYGVGLFNHLTLQQQEMLTDFVFNLGSLRSFPKFTRGVLINDINVISKEYKRYVGGKELTGRNRDFYNRYIATPVKKVPIFKIR